jgi:MFS family permease
MLIIWLQGIWLPLHGYEYKDTPLWAGIYMLPLTAGFLIAGPVSGYLSDQYGSRAFATGGLVITAMSFIGLMLLPVDFAYPLFALLLLACGIGMGMFSAPNTSSIMSSVPPGQRGVASGMRATFQNSGSALSIGVFFSLMIAGLSGTLPTTLASGLESHGVPASAAAHVADLPPVSTLFAAFLGDNPIGHLLSSTRVLGTLPAHDVSVLTGKRFFPELISAPFHHGLVAVFTSAAVMAIIAAMASALRGGRYTHTEEAPVERKEAKI